MQPSNINRIQAESFIRAGEAIGGSYVYEKKAKGLQKWLNGSKIMGIVVPVFLGGMVTSYYQFPEVMGIAIAIAAPLALVQLVYSTVLVSINLEETVAELSNMATQNALLSSDYKSLADYPPKSSNETQAVYRVLKERERAIATYDFKLSDKDHRIAKRYGLWTFQQSCPTCQQIPLSMASTNCSTCGNF
ncbi:hypothetical protein GCM10027299_43230 [Larkinella ripae]